jgi:adenylate cyclase
MSEQTFIFADLSGFTALTEVHGDEEAADLVAKFSAEVGELLVEHAAERVKTIGDAVMIRSEDPALAMKLGLRIVHQVGRQHGFPSVRVGMHTGPAVERGGDWFGATVNLAARVSGAASGGEVLLTAATRKAAGAVGEVTLQARGRRTLRNVSDPVELFAAGGESGRSAEGLVIDPVCRMAVDPRSAAGNLRHKGTEYHFCSLQCAHAFAQAPERYAGDSVESD